MFVKTRTTHLKHICAVILLALLPQLTFAQSTQNQQMAFEGSLTDNSGNPINLAGASLAFYVSAGTCYLYGETSTTAGDSQGNIIHRFGSGSVAAGSPNSFSQNLFFGSASGTTNFAGNSCSVTASDTRIAQVYYAAANITGTITLATVPYAQNATLLGGKSSTSFVQTSTDTVTLFSGGTTGQYLTKSASGLAWSNISLSAAQVTTALGYTPSSGAATVTSSSVISALGYTPSSGAAIVTSASVITALGYTPANSATTSSFILKSNNLSDLTSSSTARTNLGLGSLAVNSSVNLGTTEVTGTLATARLPAFNGDISISAGSSTATVQGLRGYPVSSTAPISGQALVFMGSHWTPVTVPTSFTAVGTVTNVSSANSDISIVSSTTTPILTLNVGTGANQILRLDGSSRLPSVDASNLTSLNASQLTSGTISAARLPALAGDVTSSIGSSTVIVSALRGISLSATAPTSGQVLKYNGSTWIPSTDATGATTSAVTSIATGNGLIGGPITSSGTISVAFGTTSGTVAAGNDARIVGALQSANNLSDLASSATARTSLGLGSLALKSSINLTSDVSGVLPAANGGSLWTNGGSGIYSTTNVAIGVSTPTARLYIASGTTALAPLKIASGTLLSSPSAGSIESDGMYLYFTDGSNVRRVLNTTTAVSGAAPTSIDNASTINSNDNITLFPQGGSVIVSSTTASTNSNTGALVVKGGLGVNGSAYFTGNLYSAGGLTTSGTVGAANLTASNGIKAGGLITTTGNISASGTFATSGTITTTSSLTASGIFSPYIYGSTQSGGSLYLEPTMDSTKGNIILAASGGNVAIGMTNPNYRFQIKSKGTGFGNFTSGFSASVSNSILLTGEDTNNNIMTVYYDSTGQNRNYLSASGTNYFTNNFVIGNKFDIAGNYIFSVYGHSAISGTMVLMGASANSVPLVLSASYTTLVSSPVAGAFEFDGANLLFTNSSLQRRRLAGGATSGTIDNVNKISFSSNALNLEGYATGTTAPVIISNSGSGTVGLQVNQNMVVSGSIKISSDGSDTAKTCAANEEGKQRYNKTLKTMEYCDGTYWQGLQGITHCPASGGVSFTLIGKAGTADAFCMTTNHFTDTTYFDAIDQCAAKTSYMNASSRVCGEVELTRACKSYATLGESGLTNFGAGTTKYWIPAAELTYAIDFSVTTGVSCSVSASTAASYTRASGTQNNYRCCYQ